jgi:putative flavoprotein involved in K+ transport
MSYHLRRRGHPHVILERGGVAERWRSERWDSLYFQFPNWMIELPGRAYSGNDPEGFSNRGVIEKFIQDYARWIEAPVRTGVDVTSVSRVDAGFLLKSGNEEIVARHVVLATGPFQRPKIPRLQGELPKDLFQVHASQYKIPGSLPEGAVLLVGSGASGFEIAEDLWAAGRTVYLCVSRHRRIPRRYRGYDNGWWAKRLGRFDIPIDQFPGRKYPPSIVVTGVNGGYDADVRRLAAKGVVILGRLLAVEAGRATLGSDAERILAEADQAYLDFCNEADDLANKDGMNLPAPDIVEPIRVEIKPIPALDLGKAGIKSVVWCTGYTYALDWLKIPVLDTRGAPIQTRGVTSCPGLFFLGLHWMHTFKSGLMFGVGEDAAHLVNNM